MFATAFLSDGEAKIERKYNTKWFSYSFKYYYETTNDEAWLIWMYFQSIELKSLLSDCFLTEMNQIESDCNTIQFLFKDFYQYLFYGFVRIVQVTKKEIIEKSSTLFHSDTRN